MRAASHSAYVGAMSVGNLIEHSIQLSEGPGSDERLESLVRRARNGDTIAFRELYAGYFRRVYAYTYVRLGEREQARDAVQDVFLGVWRGLPAFQYRHPGSFPAWLFRIARNVVAEHVRRIRRSPVVLVDDVPEQILEIEGTIISRRLVVELLTRLPETQREVVALRFLAGMSLAEVAAALGKSEGAVVQLQLRGLERLRKEVARE